jgi:hypothetical protein
MGARGTSPEPGDGTVRIVRATTVSPRETRTDYVVRASAKTEVDPLAPRVPVEEN